MRWWWKFATQLNCGLGLGTDLVRWTIWRNWLFFVTCDDGSGACVRLFVCLSVFPHDIWKKPMQQGSPNLTQKCSTKSPENPFILRSKGQRSRLRAQKTLPDVWVMRFCECRFHLVIFCHGFTVQCGRFSGLTYTVSFQRMHDAHENVYEVDQLVSIECNYKIE